MRVVVIGVGGIGGWLLPVLATFLNYQQDDYEVVLIDGDSYEDHNRTRQRFDRLGNKAEVTVERLRDQYTNIVWSHQSDYVTQDNVFRFVREGDVVFLCVDNHATRNLLSERMEEMHNGVLISGGNELTDGNVQIYLRKDGEDVTLPLTNEFHPEIANPTDLNPGEASCEQLAESAPQVVFTNNVITATMLNVFYAYLNERIEYDEIYVDILSGNSSAKNRRRELS